jgi:excisionase family DNA binding protein
MPKKDSSAVPTPPEADPLLTTAEAASLLNISPRTIEDWRLDGKLPAVKVGRLNRFRRSAILAQMEEAV